MRIIFFILPVWISRDLYVNLHVDMKKSNGIIVRHYQSPCGVLVLGSFDGKLCLCDWQIENHRERVDRRLRRILQADFEEGTSAVTEEAARQLDEYFARQRRECDVPSVCGLPMVIWHVA